MILCTLGRQPKLGLAELESLFGADAVHSLGNQAALLDIPSTAINHRRLGGAIKVAKLITTLPGINWMDAMRASKDYLLRNLATVPEGKIKLGLSVYGLKVNSKQLQTSGLELKKLIKSAGRSVRVVPNTAPELGSAQVLHNQLASPLGIELLLIAHEGQTYLAQTLSVQDIDDYTKRDFGRPKRDAFVGMLPPKLAQTMLNLAQVQTGERVLDPFCGTGVVLQEAALLGCAVYGTDLNERMVSYSQDNLDWLAANYQLQINKQLETADATNATWTSPLQHVVCETYLGQPLSGLPRPEKLEEIRRDCQTIIRKFLKNLRPQLESGTRCCIAVPAWRVGNRFVHLPLVDDLKEIGYNRVSFEHAGNNDLLYHRADQIVAREVLVLTVT